MMHAIVKKIRVVTKLCLCVCVCAWVSVRNRRGMMSTRCLQSLGRVVEWDRRRGRERGRGIEKVSLQSLCGVCVCVCVCVCVLVCLTKTCALTSSSFFFPSAAGCRSGWGRAYKARVAGNHSVSIHLYMHKRSKALLGGRAHDLEVLVDVRYFLSSFDRFLTFGLFLPHIYIYIYIYTRYTYIWYVLRRGLKGICANSGAL